MTERLYKLPESWRWVRLGEVAKVYAGSSAPQDPKYFEDGKFPFVRVSDLSSADGNEIVRARDYVNEKVNELRLKRAPAGTIVFPKSGAAILTNARAILGIEVFIVSHLAAVEVNERLAERLWVFRWLQTVDMGEFIENPSYPSLRLEKVKEIVIPLPPLEEQRRIVARIEELMSQVREAKRLRQQAKEDAERLWQSLLAETFPRPGSELPPGWRWVRLGEVCEINPRRPRLSRHPDAPTSFIPMSAVDEVTGTIVQAEVRPFAQVKKGYTYFQEGDVLFAKITPSMENGKSAVARGLIDGLGFGSTEFHVLRPSGDVVPDWIWLFVRREDFRKAAKATFRGGVGQQRVPGDFLQKVLIPLPPLDEQRRIVAHLEAVQEKTRALKSAQAETDEELKRLEQAILEKAFKGEL